MANQKEIRVKIASTKKTMKITSAMKLVAAAKVNKMQKKIEATRPYSKKIAELFANLVASLSPEDLATNQLLQNKTEINTVLLVAVSSDRGLCGAYNTNIVKATIKRIQELNQEGKTVKLMTIGRKAKSAMARHKADKFELVESFANLSSIPSSQEANLIANTAIAEFTSGAADKVEIITTDFISLVNSEVKRFDFLPISGDSVIEHNGSKAEPYQILEPGAEALIAALAPMYTENRIYQSLLEATTSELAARMTAMSNATNNAKEVIKKQTIAYNKARQASITQEISEIVGGAAALAG
ncbi:MAG: ATP synthase F1 subunit gamma [Candidatus Melainabacteria bacterium]|jgi:F-type H+-transporting ATPase subunit gamma|nr:ATP synthase F1 subunit gamma [Candidatus Melainabacteria bacterium]